MKVLINDIARIVKAIRMIVFNKVIIIANLYEHSACRADYQYQPGVPGKFITIGKESLDDYIHSFPKTHMNNIKERLYVYNDSCVAYMVQSQVVYWAFITSRAEFFEPAINANISIPADTALIYDTSTLDAFQRKGIHASAFRLVFEHINGLHKNKAVMMVLKENTPAINNLNKFNFKLVRRYIYMPLIGVSTSWSVA